MTSDLATISMAVDSAVPPALDTQWAHTVRRRPVYLVHRRIHRTCGLPVGYLVRPGSLVPAQVGVHPGLDADQAHEMRAAQSLRDSFQDLGDLPGSGAVFVRVTRAFLAGDLPVPGRPDRVVAEVDGLGECDDVVRDGLLRLKALGCRVALGDFTGRPDQRRLLPFADFVKVDSRDLELEGRPLLDLATSRGASIVAEFVDSGDALAQCRAAGIALVQGRAFEPGAPLTRSSVLSSGVSR
jgi:EAL and modified HD-GYP domain-containing signal transduction protein